MSGLPQCGTLVEVRGRQWRLTRWQSWRQCALVSLEGCDRDNAAERIRLIDPFDRLQPVAAGKPARRRRRAVLQHVLACVHATRSIGDLWIAGDARIDLLPFQLEPALAAINGATRLLLADAVGLGKTIQAGVLLGELLHRGWIERALIICPAGLRDSWKRELSSRFNVEAAILDQQAVAERVAQCPPGVNPWMACGVTITSIDFVKRDEVLAALDGVPIDLLIADEAHHLAPGTDRGIAVARLASRAAWCVMVSATPHSGDRAAFTFLNAIGEHDDPMVTFHRNRSDIGLPLARRTHFLRVHETVDERRLFDAVDRYSRAIWSMRGRHDPAARLVAITMARRAASSSAAIARTLARRLELLRSSPVEPPQPALPWDDTDDRDGNDSDSLLATPGLDDVRAECDALRELIGCAYRCGTGSKLRRLGRLLDRIGEPAIVFTEYRDTLEQILAQLTPQHRVAAIHGGLDAARRHATVDAFNSGGAEILIATDAAGEGLNLHHRCRLVVDVDVPWNPLRLEQRVGRVDRLGQTRVVHAIRLFHAGSFEAQVLDRLSLRRGRADADLTRAIAERDIATAIFENSDAPAGESLPMRSATTAREHAAREAARLSKLRGLRRHRSAGASYAAARGSSAALAFAHRLTFVNQHGAVVADDVSAHVATFAPAATEPIVQGGAAVLSRECSAIDRRCAALKARLESITTPVRRRVSAIRTALASAQRREYQRSLFDGRADAIQMQREQAAARLEASLARIERSLEGPSPAHTRIELVAAWPKDRG
jgi:superfamily II DNA or RNA helicase